MILGAKQSTYNYISSLGLLTQNYEVDKEELLENIEQTNKAINDYIELLKENYNLDPEAEYSLVLPDAEGGNAAFVKMSKVENS